MTDEQLQRAQQIVAFMRPQADEMPGNEHVEALADLADLVAALVAESAAKTKA